MSLYYSTGLVHKMLSPTGAGLGEALSGFVIDVYSSTIGRPSSANAAIPAGAELLGTVTRGGVPAVGEPSAYVLRFAEPSGRGIDKPPADIWQFTAVLAGIAGWFRVRTVDDTGGLSETAFRIDGGIDIAGTDAHLSNLDVAVNNIYTLNRFRLYWPNPV